MKLRFSALSVAAWLALAALAGIAAAASPLVSSPRLDSPLFHAEVPWPRGQAPTPTVLDAKVSDAVELFELERDEEFLEAFEMGEDSEHIFVLQSEIDAGVFDPESLFRRGDATFEHEFRELDGFGDGSLGTLGTSKTRTPPAGAPPAARRLLRVHRGAYGGLDGFSCAGCHSVGGLNGAGTTTATAFYFGDGERTSSAVVRNPPAVIGLGYVQELGREMTAELGLQRTSAQKNAAASNADVTVALSAKGVSFGSLTAHPDGSLDTSAVEGVDADLVVKPFGWKGHTAELRRFAERAARIHFGIQSHVLASDLRYDRDPALLGPSPRWYDPDGDLKERELEEGTLTALAVYLALLETPQMIPPTDAGLRERWAHGSELFDRVGCKDCHRRAMSIAQEQVAEASDTTSGRPFGFLLGKDGEVPRSPTSIIQLFSDLRRHDMGADLADANDNPDGVPRRMWLTRALWGVAESPPYLHDGRAATIRDAILFHGGEAETQRAAFEALDEEDKRDLHIFLLSLTREPKLRAER